MVEKISHDEWFERILLFNLRRYDQPEPIEDTNVAISLEYEQIMHQQGIPIRRLQCSSEKIGINYAWCSDWTSYEVDASRPVLYLEAHYDVVWKDMMIPLRLGPDIVVASCHDNRASCNILCKTIETGLLSSRKDLIIYVLFSDGEERGMVAIQEWYNSSFRHPHDKEYYLVLDVSTIPDYLSGNCLGQGPYIFQGDMINQWIKEEDQIPQMLARHRDPYPGGLCQTHGGPLYHKFKCKVSRLGVAVAGLGKIDLGDQFSGPMSLHCSHTAISLHDLDMYYTKLCQIIHRITF